MKRHLWITKIGQRSVQSLKLAFAYFHIPPLWKVAQFWHIFSAKGAVRACSSVKVREGCWGRRVHQKNITEKKSECTKREMGGSRQVAAAERKTVGCAGIILHASVYIYMHVCVHSKYIHRAACVPRHHHTLRSRASTKVFLCAPGRPAGRRNLYIEWERCIYYVLCVH